MPPPRGCNQTPPSFGAIEIVGNVRVDDAVIRRHLVYRPGEPFHLDALRESESRLTRLALFESATIEVLGTPDSDVVPTRVRVEEAGQRQVTVGGAYGSEGHLWAEGQFRHVNFLGGARTLGVAGRWSSIDRGGRVEFVEPRLFGPRYSLRATGDAQWVEEPTCSLHRGGGAVHVTRRFGPTWPPSTPTETTVSFAYASSTVDVGSVDGSAPESGSLDGVLSTVAVDFHRDTTESVLDPRQGYRVSARSEQGGGWFGGDFTYAEIQLEGRHFVSLGDRVVLANRAHAGALSQPDSAGSAVPLFTRFYLGGASSLRGWGRHEVGPLGESGTPGGGLTMFEAGSEARVQAAGPLSFAVFIDAGNAWDRSWHLDLRDLRSSVGAGVRVLTPLGPVRLDYGYQLTPFDGLVIDEEPRNRRWRVHFSIGQAF